jgi:nitrate reductase delta subunit
MNRKDNSHRLALRVLAALLGYPDADLRSALPELGAALDELAAARALPVPRLAELKSLTRQMAALDPYEAEARYVDTFDRGRKTALHLFEHVHGDSRERGPALVDLLQTYAQAGLSFGEGELPDYLPAVLEFASTQPSEIARGFLGEMAHILNAIFTALLERDSPYACVLAAVLEISGQKAQAVSIAEELPMDEAWAEPAAFDGCSSKGQSRPDAPQPVHFVRKPKTDPITRGARA